MAWQLRRHSRQSRGSFLSMQPQPVLPAAHSIDVVQYRRDTTPALTPSSLSHLQWPFHATCECRSSYSSLIAGCNEINCQPYLFLGHLGRVKMASECFCLLLCSPRCFLSCPQSEANCRGITSQQEGLSLCKGTNTTQIYLPGILEYQQGSIKITLPGDPRLQVSS